MIEALKKLILTNSAIVENALKSYLSPEKQERSSITEPQKELYDAMSYSVMSGGKRIRPFLVLEAYKAFSQEDNVEKALPYACALEMIHTYSLIHDDLPCMDNDDYRRGRLTNHKVYGEAKALLAGDTLLTYAFEVISSNPYVSDRSKVLATIALSKCAGACGMAGGQMIDLNSGDNISTYSDLVKMHSLKTGALMRCALVLGYLAFTDEPNNETIEKITRFATNIGIAFQIRDDILDVISTTEALGKGIGSDDKNGKLTAISFLNVEKAQYEVDKLTSEAIESLKDCLGENGKILYMLAKYLVERDK